MSVFCAEASVTVLVTLFWSKALSSVLCWSAVSAHSSCQWLGQLRTSPDGEFVHLLPALDQLTAGSMGILDGLVTEQLRNHRTPGCCSLTST